MLRKLRELILPDTRAPRECEACGKPFVCGASLNGCWCLQIMLSAEARKELSERYKRCLMQTINDLPKFKRRYAAEQLHKDEA